MAKVKMKASEFYDKLAKLLEKGFKLTERTSLNSDTIFRLFKDHKTFCPITAVTYSETGKYFSTDDYQLANRCLGLHYDVAEAIVGGADCDEDKSRTRSKLKRALGLKTVEA